MSTMVMDNTTNGCLLKMVHYIMRAWGVISDKSVCYEGIELKAFTVIIVFAYKAIDLWLSHTLKRDEPITVCS